MSTPPPTPNTHTPPNHPINSIQLDNRIGSAEFTVPPRTSGPPPHVSLGTPLPPSIFLQSILPPPTLPRPGLSPFSHLNTKIVARNARRDLPRDPRLAALPRQRRCYHRRPHRRLCDRASAGSTHLCEFLPSNIFSPSTGNLSPPPPALPTKEYVLFFFPFSQITQTLVKIRPPKQAV
jgi:hypothetical protein